MAKENSTSYQQALERLPKHPYELPYLWYQLLTVGLAYGSNYIY